jgi:hypothetical protein
MYGLRPKARCGEVGRTLQKLEFSAASKVQGSHRTAVCFACHSCPSGSAEGGAATPSGESLSDEAPTGAPVLVLVGCLFCGGKEVGCVDEVVADELKRCSMPLIRS